MKYEFTITLRPAMYSHTAKEQHKICSELLFGIFKDYEVTCVAELTREHNVHYHCYIELGDIRMRDKLYNKFRRHNKVFGKKSLSQVIFDDSYRGYIKKSIDEVREVIGDPIVRDSFGICKMLFSIQSMEQN